jgi:hypothetical protein
MEREQHVLHPVIDFLRAAGLDCRLGRRLHAQVMPGVWADRGALIVSGGPFWAVLHEAAHLALLPEWARNQVQPGDMFDASVWASRRVLAADDIARDDAAATCWAAAAGELLGLPEQLCRPPDVPPMAISAVTTALEVLPDEIRPSLDPLAAIRLRHGLIGRLDAVEMGNQRARLRASGIDCDTSWLRTC